ncbi:MAG: hypothetical protein VXW91_01070 [Pseudomonadota bacterium]|mgnify:CR=1 FL=1|nr:hypothetical protein [Pseudomonadota bacterium]MEC8664159.1 hypothetical protein [Pseudomonadota bacterium]
MFTSIDKAIVALLGAIVFLVAEFTDLEQNFISQEVLQSVAAVVTAILVYIVPNKVKKTDADKS